MLKIAVLVSLVLVALAGYGVPSGNSAPAAAGPMYPVYPPAFYPYPRRHRHRHHHHHQHDDSSSSSESDSHSHEKTHCKSCKKLTSNCNNIANVELCRKPNITVVTKYGCAHAMVSCPTDAEYFLIHDRNASNVFLFGKANDVFAKCNKGKSWIINGTTVNNVACIIPKKKHSEYLFYLFFSGTTITPPTTTSLAHSTTVEPVITSTTTSTSIASTTTVNPTGCGSNAMPSGSGCECVTGFTDILDTTLPDRVNYTERGMKCISTDPCKTVVEPFTVIFVIDSSGSIGAENWGPLLSFIELAAPLVPKTSRVGFVKYATFVTANLMLSDNWTEEEFINKIPRTWDNADTMTYLGLTAAADLLQVDPKSKRIVVLFTDGKPSNEHMIPPALDLLKSVNAKLRIMGFGPYLSSDQHIVKSWLDNPTEDYFPFYSSPQNLTSAHMNSILTSVCKA